MTELSYSPCDECPAGAVMWNEVLLLRAEVARLTRYRAAQDAQLAAAIAEVKRLREALVSTSDSPVTP